MRSGSPPTSAASAGSIEANRSLVGGCHVHRRLVASSVSPANGSGMPARTVDLRTAFIRTEHSVHHHPSTATGDPSCVSDHPNPPPTVISLDKVRYVVLSWSGLQSEMR